MSIVYFGILLVVVCVGHLISETHRNKLADMLGMTLEKLEHIERQLEDIER